jgi:hypothetical protein
MGDEVSVLKPNLVVAVKSCVRDMERGFHTVIRETWGRKLEGKARLLFFIGTPERPVSLKADEIVVDAPDDYMSLPKKTQEICRWALGQDLTHIFLCDNDTIVNAEDFMAVPYYQYDYSGHFCRTPINRQFDYKDRFGEYPNCYPWCSGGVGYFLSQKACKKIANTDPQVWAEDVYVGQALGPDINIGALKAGLVSMEDAAHHFVKSKKYPACTPILLRRIQKEGQFLFYQTAKMP